MNIALCNKIKDYIKDNSHLYNKDYENICINDLLEKAQKLNTNCLEYNKIFYYIFCKVACVINPFASKLYFLNEDDLFDFLLQALWRAISTFDISKKIKFSTYFVACFKRIANNPSNNKKIKNYNIQCFYLSDNYQGVYKDYDNIYINIETTKVLSNNEKLFLKLLLQKYTIEEIKKIMGIKNNRIYKMKNHIQSIYKLGII